MTSGEKQPQGEEKENRDHDRGQHDDTEDDPADRVHFLSSGSA
jgi:hypothetical protein